MKKELIGKTKEERDLVWSCLTFFIVIMLFLKAFSCTQAVLNHNSHIKQQTTSVDGQGVK